MAVDEGCLAKIAAAGRISTNKALQLLEEVSDRAEKMRVTGEPDRFVNAAGQLAGDLINSAKKQKLDALVNANARQSILNEIEANGGLKNAVLTLRSILHGTSKGDKYAIESQWKGLTSEWQGVLRYKFAKAGVEKAAVSGAMDEDIAKEMWAMNAGEKTQATTNNPARKAAEAMQPALAYLRERLNAAGAAIDSAPDFVAHTTHNPIKMRAAAGPKMSPDEAFGAWWKATRPRLADKTFENVIPAADETQEQAETRFGRSVFDALVSGIHMTPKGATGLATDENGYVPIAFEGSRNIGRKLSQPRVLYWKDAESWLGNMQDFGTSRSLSAAVMHSIDQGARHVALMERLGTNPTANFNQIVRRIQETYRSDLDGIKKFQGKINGLEAVMAHLDGSANIPANAAWAHGAATYRTFLSMADLGGVGITHFASIWPTVQAEMVHHGVSRLETIGNMIGALLKGKGPEERQEILADLGAYAHGLTRDMFNNWQAEDTIPGRISSIANTFMKYTGIHYIFDNTQAAIRAMLSHNLARNAGKDFSQLDPHLSQMLGKYGINAEDWDLLRSVPDLAVYDGRAYLTPKDALRIDKESATPILAGRGLPEDGFDKYAQGLSDRLSSYFNDTAQHGVVTAGVRERAAVLGKDRPGSFGGELRRFLAQFKMWPIAAMHQIIGREVYMSLSGKEAAWNLGMLVALSTAAGYMRMTVNDYATGNAIRNPSDPRTLAAALAQGGGVGILGDFLFGDVLRNRFGSGLVSTLGGPAVSDVDNLIHIFSEWKQGKAGWPDMARFAVRHIPFANLVYLKGALDYLAFYHMYEAASPGWWERTNRRMLKEQGRTMAGYVPSQGVPYTPWGITLH